MESLHFVDPKLKMALHRAKYADRDEAVQLCFRACDALERLEYDYMVTRQTLAKLAAEHRTADVCPCIFVPRQTAPRGGRGEVRLS